MNMKKKIKLEYKEEYDFFLLGVASFDKDYRFIWNINHGLEMNFSRIEDHRTKHPKTGKEQLFSSYQYEDPERLVNYVILSNKSETGFLMDSLKNIDFLILIKGDVTQKDASTFKTKIQNIENVLAAFILEAEKLKNPERLLLN